MPCVVSLFVCGHCVFLQAASGTAEGAFLRSKEFILMSAAIKLFVNFIFSGQLTPSLLHLG